MSYQKFVVDNTVCSRRFHITFDDQADKKPRVEVRCHLCSEVVFQADNHAPMTLARVENLVKTSALSELVTSDCLFEDTLSKRTIKPTAEKRP